MEPPEQLLLESGEALLSDLYQLLVVERRTLSEYDLMQCLARGGLAAFGELGGGDQLRLFTLHFTLFHLLYRLQRQWLSEGIGYLSVTPLGIGLQPLLEGGGNAIGDHDPVRDYYLDITQLTTTSAAAIDRLLGRFWAQFAGGSARAEALATLGLEGSVGPAALRRRYQELVMRHHPDRGGDQAHLQAINAAMATLRGR